MIEIRPLRSDDWAEWRAVRLEALGDSPEAFTSKLADWEGPGDTEPRWRSRLETVEYNVLATLDGQSAGQVSGLVVSSRPSTVELISMWVAPFARGKGVGDRLIEAVMEWARQRPAERVVLDVMIANSAARNLYERHGFVALDDRVDDRAVHIDTASWATTMMRRLQTD